MSKTHVIDGVTYVEVDRKAEVGERVIDKSDGEIAEVLDLVTSTNSTYRFGVKIRANGIWIDDSEYYVLEPLPNKETPDVADLLANLARRVVSLEHKIESLCDQLRDTQRNLETFAEQTERNTIDIAMLDNRTYSLTTVQSAEGLLIEIERLLKRRSDCR
jgi:hypothetical protein